MQTVAASFCSIWYVSALFAMILVVIDGIKPLKLLRMRQESIL